MTRDDSSRTISGILQRALSDGRIASQQPLDRSFYHNLFYNAITQDPATGGLTDAQLEEVSKDSAGLIRMYNFFTGKLTDSAAPAGPIPTGKQCYDELKIESRAQTTIAAAFRGYTLRKAYPNFLDDLRRARRTAAPEINQPPAPVVPPKPAPGGGDGAAAGRSPDYDLARQYPEILNRRERREILDAIDKSTADPARGNPLMVIHGDITNNGKRDYKHDCIRYNPETGLMVPTFHASRAYCQTDVNAQVGLASFYNALHPSSQQYHSFIQYEGRFMINRSYEQVGGVAADGSTSFKADPYHKPSELIFTTHNQVTRMTNANHVKATVEAAVKKLNELTDREIEVLNDILSNKNDPTHSYNHQGLYQDSKDHIRKLLGGNEANAGDLKTAYYKAPEEMKARIHLEVKLCGRLSLSSKIDDYKKLLIGKDDQQLEGEARANAIRSINGDHNRGYSEHLVNEAVKSQEALLETQRDNVRAMQESLQKSFASRTRYLTKHSKILSAVLQAEDFTNFTAPPGTGVSISIRSPKMYGKAKRREVAQVCFNDMSSAGLEPGQEPKRIEPKQSVQFIQIPGTAFCKRVQFVRGGAEATKYVKGKPDNIVKTDSNTDRVIVDEKTVWRMETDKDGARIYKPYDPNGKVIQRYVDRADISYLKKADEEMVVETMVISRDQVKEISIQKSGSEHRGKSRRHVDELNQEIHKTKSYNPVIRTQIEEIVTLNNKRASEQLIGENYDFLRQVLNMQSSNHQAYKAGCGYTGKPNDTLSHVSDLITGLTKQPITLQKPRNLAGFDTLRADLKPLLDRKATSPQTKSSGRDIALTTLRHQAEDYILEKVLRRTSSNKAGEVCDVLVKLGAILQSERVPVPTAEALLDDLSESVLNASQYEPGNKALFQQGCEAFRDNRARRAAAGPNPQRAWADNVGGKNFVRSEAMTL